MIIRIILMTTTHQISYNNILMTKRWFLIVSWQQNHSMNIRGDNSIKTVITKKAEIYETDDKLWTSSIWNEY